jgi:hypothetical protein
MHFLFNLLKINILYIFRALLALPQEGLHKRHLVYCVCVMLVGCTSCSQLSTQANWRVGISTKIYFCTELYPQTVACRPLNGPPWGFSSTECSCNRYTGYLLQDLHKSVHEWICGRPQLVNCSSLLSTFEGIPILLHETLNGPCDSLWQCTLSHGWRSSLPHVLFSKSKLKRDRLYLNTGLL